MLFLELGLTYLDSFVSLCLSALVFNVRLQNYTKWISYLTRILKGAGGILAAIGDGKFMFGNHVCRLTLLILAAITLTSCGGQAEEKSLALQLQIEPVPSVYIQYDSRSSVFRIGNELVERRISVNTETHRVFTTAFINKLSGRNYTRSPGEEFSFRANGTKLSGVTGDFEYIDHETFGGGGVKGLTLALGVKREDIGILRVRLIYEIYPRLPVIRKWIEIENRGGSSVAIDSVQVESLSLIPGSEYDVEVYNDRGALAFSPVVFDVRLVEGFCIGNEAPGVLKHSDIYSNGNLVSIGMKPCFQKYAAEIQLAPNEEFISPAAFILFFKGEPNQSEGVLKEFIAEHIAWSKTPEYSVWYENVSANTTEPEAREKMRLAAKSGANVFCLTGRWMDKRGDWTINENSCFNNLSQYAHSLEMKFGLSIELAAADSDSQIMAECSHWVAKSKDGSDYTINDASGGKMMCLGSEYTLYAAHEIDRLVTELNLNYIRLTGPMIPDRESSGCFAEDHVHRSSAESLWYIYEGLFAVCKYLHSRHPDLIIDVSPEFYNPDGTIDYALLRYADVAYPN